jgi:hypothetical protein
MSPISVHLYLRISLELFEFMALFIGMFIGHLEDQDEKVGWYSYSS